MLIAICKYVNFRPMKSNGLKGRRSDCPVNFAVEALGDKWSLVILRDMDTDEFKKGIEQLLVLAAEKRTAIMCSEAVWWRCHRSMISDHLKAEGVIVEHILGPSKTETHPYTSAATIVDGRLIYGSAENSTRSNRAAIRCTRP